jgi:Tol biopolymer transport system component
MRNLFVLTAVAAVLFGAAVTGRLNDSPVQTAALAWDRGDYVVALDTYLRVLGSSPSQGDIEAIALQTGELYRTTELTTDGALPRFSPDGRTLLYETGIGLARNTWILSTNGSTVPVTELHGFGAAYSPDGTRLAYLAVRPTPELARAEAAIDQGPAADRTRRQADFNELVARASRIVVRTVGTGRESEVPLPGFSKAQLTYGARGVWFSGKGPGDEALQIYEVHDDGRATARTSGPQDQLIIRMNATGTALLCIPRVTPASASLARTVPRTFTIIATATGHATTMSGFGPAFSGDGATLAFVTRNDDGYRLMAAAVPEPVNASVVRTGTEPIDAPALTADGSRLAFQMMSKNDWEIYTINRDGTAQARVTREIQHDVLPVFLSPDRILAAVGEPRHRRSYVYDLPAGTRTRLFHNNSVRTIAPEYSWQPAPDGSRVLLTAERDGDTVTPDRGVYLVDLTQRVTGEDLRARIRTSLERERDLRDRGARMFAPIADAVAGITAQASIDRIYKYEKSLFDFDSKFVTEPGNARAAAFLFDTYKSFGYAPQYQPFQYRLPAGATGQTANVIATLTGTENPDLIYVVSSHYDSALVSPGADDDSSGTAALLETARLLAAHPQPATIVFASFTGEEAGLFGSREFVRRAVGDKLHIVGALNNDMVGWANDERLDDTIRYSNAGIRDLQHAAAMQFSKLITYDAHYYKNTDAAAYYEAYGDIVGGIGSYPVLGSPHYHQPHDLLESINHQLVTEVAKTTAASVMLLASSPSRIDGLQVTSFSNGTAAIAWKPSPERSVTGYLVRWRQGSGASQQMRVDEPSASVSGVRPGAEISVKAVNAKGLEGWDWATTVVH